MSDITVAHTILTQLGGARFLVMTGAKNLVGSSNSLSMKLPRNKSKANHLRIELTVDDLYNVAFSTFRNLDLQPVDTSEGVYADQLVEVFERVTGMRASL